MRVWLRVCGVLLTTSATSFILIHTAPVRAIVRDWASQKLSNASGIVIRAENLEYSLLHGWLEIKGVTARAGSAPPLLVARRVYLEIPIFDLLDGNFSRAVITADGVAWRLERDLQGRWNVPVTTNQSESSSTPYFQALRMRDVALVIADRQSGGLIALPKGQLSAYQNSSFYKISYRTSRDGRFESRSLSGPLNLTMEASLSSDAFLLQPLEVISGKSRLLLENASFMFTGNGLSAKGRIEIDAGQFSHQVLGGASGTFSISGTTTAPVANLQLASRELRISNQQVRNLTVGARYGERKLQVLEAKGEVSGVQVRLQSFTDFGKPQFETRASAEVDRVALDRLLAEAGWKASQSLTGSARLEATCSGSDWRQAALSGTLSVGSRPELSFRARMTGQDVMLNLDAPEGSTLGASGTVRISTGSTAISGDLKGRIERLGNLHQLAGLSSQEIPANLRDAALDWHTGFGGTLKQPQIEFGATSTGLSLPVMESGTFEIAGLYDRSGTQLNRLSLQSGDQEILAQGTIGPESALHIDGAARNISVTRLMEQTGDSRDSAGLARAEFSLRGTIAKPQGRATLGIDDLKLFGQKLGPVEASADLQNDILSISKLHLTQPHDKGSGELSGSGSIDLTARTYEIQATGKELQIKDPALEGEIGFEAKGRGSLDKPQIHVAAKGKEFKTPALRIGQIDSEIQYSEDRATIQAQAPDLKASAHGQIEFTGDQPFRVEIGTTGAQVTLPQSFGQPITGLFEGTATASGSIKKQELQTAAVVLKTAKLDVNGFQIENQKPIQVDLDGGQIRVQPVSIQAGAALLNISGSLPLDLSQAPGRITITGTAGLEKARAQEGIELGGTLKMDAAITGSLRQWEPTLNLILENGRVSSTAFPATAENLQAQANIVDRVLRIERLEGKLAGGDLKGSASVPLHLLWNQIGKPATNPNEPIRWSVRTEHSQIRKSTADQSAIIVSLHSEGEAASLAIADAKGILEFDELTLRGSRGEMSQSGPTRVILDGSAVRLEETELKGSTTTIHISGTSRLTPDPTMDLKVTGEADAAFLTMLDDSIDSAGRISFDVNINGDVRNPGGTGSVRLENGSLAVRGVPARAEEINGLLNLEKNRIVLSNLSGRLNGGKVTAEGEAKFIAGKIADVSAHAHGDNVFLNYPSGFRTSSNLDLTLRSGERGLVLGGRVEVNDGVYRDPLDLRTNSAEAVIARALPTTKNAAGTIGLDIEIVTKQPVELDNNIGRIAANGNLRLRGDIDNPLLGGEIRLEEGGRLYFGDRTYDIQRGNIRFDGTSKGFDPRLNVLASTRASNYEIRLNLSGGMKDLTTTFTSDPPMSRNDIISVLLTGKTISENRGVDIRRLEAYALVSSAFNATMGGSMGRKLGVSQVSVQPGMIAAESDPQPRLTITEDFTRALRLVYSMNLSDSADQIWIVEYDLSRSMRTRAVKESDNAYRSELRHEIRFGGGVSASGPGAAQLKRKIGKVSFQGGEPFEEHELAKQFKVKTGKKYSPVGVRKGNDHLVRFLQGKGYLEARVHVNREEHENTVDLDVEVATGPDVTLQYTGDQVAGGVQKQIRKAWQSGQTDRQRISAAQQVLTSHYGSQGYLQLKSEGKVETSENAKHVTLDLQRGRRYSNVRVKLSGASEVHNTALLELLQKANLTKAMQTEPRRVADAVTRYYHNRGHLAVEVGEPRAEMNEEAGTGQFVIDVKEGPEYHVGELRFKGNHALRPADLLVKSPLSSGVLFEPARLSAAVTDMRLKYEALGYREIVLEYQLQPNAEKALLDIDFVIQEKDQRVVQSVAVEGNKQISEKFVRSQLEVSEGNPENATGVSQSIQNLSRTGAFASVDIESRPAGLTVFAPRVGSDLVVKVQEPKPFRVLYGPLYNSKSGIGFIADFENRNMLGDARVLGLRTRYDGDLREFRLYLTQPVWRRLAIQSTATTYSTQEEVVEGIIKTTEGASVQQDWPISSKYLLSWGYRYENFTFDLKSGDTRLPPGLRVTSAPIFYTGSRDTRDSFLDATRGSFIALGGEIAPAFLGSDFGYVRWSGQYSKYFPLTKPRPVPYGEEPKRSRLIYATSIRIGLQRGLSEEGIVLTDRFFAGGGTTIRGFKQDSVGPQTPDGRPIGGNAMLVLNNELRFPLFWFFDAVAFSDIGNVYPNVAQFRLTDVRKSGGFGLRIRNPFVVLRLDYGIKLDRRPGESFGTFFFSIGQAF